MRVLRKLHLRENIVLLTIAGVVSAAIIIVAAAAFNAHYSNVASISDAQNLNSTFWAGAGIVFVITLNCHHLVFPLRLWDVGWSSCDGRSIGYES
ncbi:MAG TPA: hypothetical protein VEL70_07765 [Candidatus Acidoferrum sp.]|nr:hypothetical protein [Candidatus Acidoferrum sp.]